MNNDQENKQYELEDFSPDDGHRHECPKRKGGVVGSHCNCAVLLYEMLQIHQERARKIRENTGTVWLNAMHCVRPSEDFIRGVGKDVVDSIRNADNPEKEFEPFAPLWAIRVIAS